MTSDLQSPSTKQRKLAFVADAEMPLDGEPYRAWITWRNTAAATSAFLTVAEKGSLAAKYHTRLMTDGLDMQGLDALLSCAADELDAPTSPLCMSPYTAPWHSI